MLLLFIVIYQIDRRLRSLAKLIATAMLPGEITWTNPGSLANQPKIGQTTPKKRA